MRKKSDADDTPKIGDWPYFSKEKQALVIELGRLYPIIKLVYFYKVMQDDGTLIRGGTEPDPTLYPFFSQIGYKHLEMHKEVAKKLFNPRLLSQIGRELTLEEIRIAFRPVVTTLRSVFVDDVPITAPAHIRIETSPDNWQAHFLLDKEVSLEDAAKIQKYMIKRLDGDTGAGSPVQARRFPEGQFVHNVHRPALDTDMILKQVAESTQENTHTVVESEYDSSIWTDEAFEQLYTRLRKGRTDLSSCDLSFCVYLVAKGFQDEDIYEALLKVSPEVTRRHPNIDYYIHRTISVARRN